LFGYTCSSAQAPQQLPVMKMISLVPYPFNGKELLLVNFYFIYILYTVNLTLVDKRIGKVTPVIFTVEKDLSVIMEEGT
jgi:hypothetical protein